MDLANKSKQQSITERDIFINKSKKKKEHIFFAVIIILSLLTIVLNFHFLNKEYLKVSLYVYNSKEGKFEFKKEIIPKGKNKV